MNLKAAAKDNPGDLGSPGESLISEISPAPAAIPAARFDIRAAAHQAATREYPFPQGARIVSCRIDKRSDQGMSWGPALALVWEEEKKFLLVGVREKTPVFNVTTSSGELITGAALASYPAFDLPSTAFRLSPPPRTVQLAANRRGVRLAERASGAAIEAEFLSDRGIRARWRAELRNQSNYIRQTLELSAVNKNVALTGVELGDVRVPDATVVGNCPGSPVSGGQMFLGVEMPGAQSAIAPTGREPAFPAIWLSRRHRPIPSVPWRVWCRQASFVARSCITSSESGRGRPSRCCTTTVGTISVFPSTRKLCST